MEQKEWGVEASESKDNAYYVPGCTHAQHRPPYAACLCRIAERKHGRLEERPECSAAIGRKDCPAQAMRSKELEAGKALFFVSRSELNEQMRQQAEESGQRIAEMVALGRDWAPSARRKKPAAKSPAAAPATAPAGGSTYADAINAAIAAAKSTAPAAPPAPQISIAEQPAVEKPSSPALESSVTADLSKKPAAGMSMLELARLARQRQTAAAAA